MPKKLEYQFRTQRKTPKLGLMLVGWGGNNGSTCTAGILANKHKMEWETKEGKHKANYFGSLTQASTCRCYASRFRPSLSLRLRLRPRLRPSPSPSPSLAPRASRLSPRVSHVHLQPLGQRRQPPDLTLTLTLTLAQALTLTLTLTRLGGSGANHADVHIPFSSLLPMVHAPSSL